jgi:hypothetical protein
VYVVVRHEVIAARGGLHRGGAAALIAARRRW